MRCPLLIAAIAGLMATTAYGQLPMNSALAGARHRAVSNCQFGSCITSLQSSVQLFYRIPMSPELLDELNGQTRFSVRFDATQVNFRLTNDPNYFPGKRSVSVQRLGLAYGAPGLLNVRMDWNQQELRVLVTGSANLSYAENDGPKSNNKEHTQDARFEVDGSEFIGYEEEVLVDLVYADIERHNPNGSTNEQYTRITKTRSTQ